MNCLKYHFLLHFENILLRKDICCDLNKIICARHVNFLEFCCSEQAGHTKQLEVVLRNFAIHNEQ